MDCQLKFMVWKPCSLLWLHICTLSTNLIYNYLTLIGCRFPLSAIDHSLFASCLLIRHFHAEAQQLQKQFISNDGKKLVHLFTNISLQEMSISSNEFSQMICSDTLWCFQIIKTKHYAFYISFPITHFFFCFALIVKMTELSTKKDTLADWA